ncbi:tetratricopeptide repeat protein [Spongiimicrobium sp. 2-473A-2-J]|uniref:tetratricopeptide repeat protein n=1 Tax=Eudoraea algarum TaxID=3417568 RepID=UPI003D36409E
MLINNSIFKKLANQVLENTLVKEDLRVYCFDQTEKALKSWESNKPNKATRDINKAIQFLPDVPFLLIMKALFYCSAKKTVESNSIIDSLNEIELSELELNLMQYIASCNHVHERKFHESIWFADEIIKRDEKAYYAYFPKAISLQELNEHKKAIKNFKIALKEKLLLNEIKACLAFSYMKNKKFIKALVLHLSVKKYFEENYKVNHHIGVNFFLLNFFAKSLKYVNKSIELKSDFAEAYRTRGLIYLTQGKKSKAKEELEIARKLGATDIDKTMNRFKLNEKNNEA